MRQDSIHCNRRIHSFFWDQNTCLLIYVIQDVKRSLNHLKRLGRIWLAEGASNLGLRLIPLITFCNQRLSSQNSELESELRSYGSRKFWLSPLINQKHLSPPPFFLFIFFSYLSATRDYYRHLGICQILQLRSDSLSRPICNYILCIGYKCNWRTFLSPF